MRPTIQTLYDPNLPTILFSLHPLPTEQIRLGEKVLEYRKHFLKHAFQGFVHMTGAHGGVTLFVRCAQPLTAAPAKLAELGHRLQHDDPQAIQAYLGAAGIAIPISAVATLPTLSAQTLRTVDPTFVAPRTFVYLDKPQKQALLAFLLSQPYTNYLENDWCARIKTVRAILGNCAN